jgi:hypothetical protein
MCKIPIKNQEQNCVTHHNTLCRFDGSGILEKRTDHSSSVFAISQSQIHYLALEGIYLPL